MTLQEFFAENPRAAIAFSGGVDSSYLLYAARAVRCRRATLTSPRRRSSRSLSWTTRGGSAENVGAKLTVLELDAPVLRRMWRAILQTAATTASKIFSEI